MSNTDYEKKYEAVLQTAKQWIADGCTDKERIALEAIFPELRKSEDERIRKDLIGFIEDIINHGIKEAVAKHNYGDGKQWIAYLEKQKEPCCTEEVQKWKKELNSLCKEHYGQKSSVWDSPIMTNEMLMEKQKEQKPAEPSIDELQRYEEEFYNFKVFAAKQAKEHHISFVHDFEWNNFCAELLSYFNEKQKPVDTTEIAHCINCPVYEKAEWSEEDEKMLVSIINDIKGYDAYVGTIATNFEAHKKRIAWLNDRLKSLRPQPHWKPSDEQMMALNLASAYAFTERDIIVLESLYNDLKKLKEE